MVIGRKLFGSYLFPLFLNIGLMLPIIHISGIISVSNYVIKLAEKIILQTSILKLP
jgi:uncharacterized BrkB/YihY/UPF0761 family membrane protein